MFSHNEVKVLADVLDFFFLRFVVAFSPCRLGDIGLAQLVYHEMKSLIPSRMISTIPLRPVVIEPNSTTIVLPHRVLTTHGDDLASRYLGR